MRLSQLRLGAMGEALVLAECDGGGGGGWRVLYPFTGSRKWRPFGINSALKRWAYSALTSY